MAGSHQVYRGHSNSFPAENLQKKLHVSGTDPRESEASVRAEATHGNPKRTVSLGAQKIKRSDSVLYLLILQ